MSYSVDDIVGLTLYAKKQLPVYALPWDNEVPIRQIPAGGSVGKVHSYLAPKPGRATMYWMFYDDQGNAYYAPQRTGLYDLDALRDQGLQTDAEKEEASKTVFERTASILSNGMLAYGVIQVISRLISR